MKTYKVWVIVEEMDTVDGDEEIYNDIFTESTNLRYESEEKAMYVAKEMLYNHQFGGNENVY